jgi:subtilisin family serine protease
MSLSDPTNSTAFDRAAADEPRNRIETAIAKLRTRGVVVVAAAGNAFTVHSQRDGMGFPAILPGVISVGAVHSTRADECVFNIREGDTVVVARIEGAERDDIAPFSQRLPRRGQHPWYTRLMAPGVGVPTVGTDAAEADGTSPATAMVSGVVALMQEAHKQNSAGVLPTCDQIEEWLRASAEEIAGAKFRRLDAKAVSQARDPATS